MENAVTKRLDSALVNPETGELVTDRPFQNTFDVAEMVQTAGQITLTEPEKKILYASVDKEDVEIRPDGLVYLPWQGYASRLRDTFGLEWALIPQGMPKFSNNFIYWGFWLIIKGHLCGYAVGEQQYFPSSQGGKQFMTYGDACEGAKSNALMRLCKGIGISLELWKPSFVRKWREKYAEQYKGNDGKTYWRKKLSGIEVESTTETSLSEPMRPGTKTEGGYQDPNAPATPEQTKVFLNSMKNYAQKLGQSYQDILKVNSYKSAKDIKSVGDQEKIIIALSQQKPSESVQVSPKEGPDGERIEKTRLCPRGDGKDEMNESHCQTKCSVRRGCPAWFEDDKEVA